MLGEVELNFEINNLKQIRKTRFLVRKRVLKYIRQHCLRNESSNNYLVNSVRRKARNNWMADLSDKQLIEYLELIKKGEVDG